MADSPIPDHKGRIIVLAVPGLTPPIGVGLSVFLDDKLVSWQITSGEHTCVDLDPGTYRIVLDYKQPEQYIATVTLGAVTTIRAKLRGRLVTHVRDALGQPVQKWVEVYHGEQRVHLGYADGEGKVDLYAGTYRVVIAHEQPDVLEIGVPSGTEAEVTSRPRGRLEVTTTDGLAQPISVWVEAFLGEERSACNYTGEQGRFVADLLPGDYRVTTGFSQPDELRASLSAGAIAQLASPPRGRLAIHTPDGQHAWVETFTREARAASNYTNDVGTAAFDLLPGKYLVKARSEPPSECESDVVPHAVTDAPPVPEERSWRTSGDGTATLRLTDGASLDLAIDVQHGRGATIAGRLEREMPGGSILSYFAGDSEAHRGSHDFEAHGTMDVPIADSTLRAPTRDLVRAYLRQLVRRGVDPSQWPDELRTLVPHEPAAPPADPIDLNRGPAIYTVGGERWPGGELELVGDFPDGTLEVWFAPPIDGTPDEDRRALAQIIGRSRTAVTVRVPNVTGRCYVWGVSDGARGAPFKLKKIEPARPADADPGLVSAFRDAMRAFDPTIALRAILGAVPGAQDVAKLAYRVTRESGQFRYVVASNSGELAPGRPYRWLLFADGNLRDGYKDGTFKISAALFGSRIDPDAATPDLASRVIDILTVNTHKTDGDQIYEVRLFDDELGALLGGAWNKDKKTFELTQILGFDTEESGLSIAFDSDAKQARIALRLDPEASLAITAGQDGGVLALEVKERRQVGGRTWTFNRGHRLADEAVQTELSIEREAIGPDDASFNTTIRFADPPERDAPVAAFAVQTRVALDSTTVALDFNYADRRLQSAGAAFAYADGRDRVGLRLGYQAGPFAEGGGRHRWTLGATTKHELFGGDLELETGLTGSLDVHGHEVRAFELSGNAELSIDPLHITLGARGSYRRWFGETPGERYSATGYGSIELAKAEVILSVTHSREAGQSDTAVELGIDIGGILGNFVKQTGQEPTQRFELYRHVSD